MKTPFTVFALTLGATLILSAPRPAVAEDAPRPEARRAGDSDRSADAIRVTDLEAIRLAPDPSSAVAAFARATTGDADQVVAKETYVRRMVELGVPEMAYAQARDLTERQVDNGLAWAVLADGDARRGEPVAALREVVKAVQRLPGDAFVQRTAGELIAWYDSAAGPADVPAGLKTAIEAVRRKLADESAFSEAYRAASEYYREAKAAGEQPAKSAEPDQAEPEKAGGEWELPARVLGGDGGYEAPAPVYSPRTTYIYQYPYGWDGYPFDYRAYYGYPSFYGDTWWPINPVVVVPSGRSHRCWDYRGTWREGRSSVGWSSGGFDRRSAGGAHDHGRPRGAFVCGRGRGGDAGHGSVLRPWTGSPIPGVFGNQGAPVRPRGSDERGQMVGGSRVQPQGSPAGTLGGRGGWTLPSHRSPSGTPPARTDQGWRAGSRVVPRWSWPSQSPTGTVQPRSAQGNPTRPASAVRPATPCWSAPQRSSVAPPRPAAPPAGAGRSRGGRHR